MSETWKMNNKKILMGVGVVTGVLIAAIIGVFVFQNTPGQLLKKQLFLGHKYLSELRYEDAVLAYKSVLDIDEKCEEGYVGLARAYLGLEQFDNAEAIIEKGLTFVGDSKTLKDFLYQIEDLIESENKELKDSNGQNLSMDTEEKTYEDQEPSEKPEETRLIDQPENQEAPEEDEIYEPGRTTIDLSDFAGERTRGYGGNLEEKIAEALNTTAEYDEMTESSFLFDGSIEIFDASNGTGFFINQYDPVEGFTIFGISIGMNENEAVRILKDQGMTDDHGTFAIDINDFYISIEIQNGKVSTIRYTKCYTR